MPKDAQQEVIYGMMIASDIKAMDDKNWENVAKILKTRIRVLENNVTQQNHEILNKIAAMDALNATTSDKLTESIADLTSRVEEALPIEKKIQK